MSENITKSDIQKFWKALYNSLYSDVDTRLTKEFLLKALDDLADLFGLSEHMAVIEMPLTDLNGKRVLEIGPGAGGHSALFARHGAIVTSVDLTYERAKSTAEKLALLDEYSPSSQALQSDAERLPFENSSFDIVYSNGVLHHTNNTESAIEEVHRVLKPGGAAVIMLYCKSSWHYWFNMLLCVGFLQGKLFTGKNWLGRATEWGGRHSQTVENPITRCYTAGGIRKLFTRFDSVSLRKGAFYFRLIPKLGRLIQPRLTRRYGLHDGGYLIYGEPWPLPSKSELWLGKYIGWAWFIRAVKEMS